MGFQVTPERVRQDFPIAAKQLAEFGLQIASIAGPVEEATIAVCVEVGVPVIRIRVSVHDGPYLTVIEEEQRRIDAIVPLLERHHVRIGVQNHCHRFVCHALGLRHLVGRYDPRHVAAVWDPAHNALNDEDPEMAADILWPHLCMVNLKNAFWQREWPRSGSGAVETLLDNRSAGSGTLAAGDRGAEKASLPRCHLSDC